MIIDKFVDLTFILYDFILAEVENNTIGVRFVIGLVTSFRLLCCVEMLCSLYDAMINEMSQRVQAPRTCTEHLLSPQP